MCVHPLPLRWMNRVWVCWPWYRCPAGHLHAFILQPGRDQEWQAFRSVKVSL